MAKQTYECYLYKRNGFPRSRVYLDGKTQDGRTVYKNEDMSPHQHKLQGGQASQQSQKPMLDIINAKLDRILAIFETQK